MNRLLAIEDRLFTEGRLGFYGLGVVVAYAISLTWRGLNHHWLILPDGNMRGIDFGWMWLSGRLAASGDAAQVFDWHAFSTAQSKFYFPFSSSEISFYFNRFYYPPTFLFFMYPLGLMPYLIAWAGWIAASFILYEAAVYAIISRRVALIAAATPFVVFANIDFAHTGFLTAGLMGLSLAFIEGRPWFSGIFLGLLTYKPQFGVLFPAALVASRNWRALGNATAVAVFLGVAAAVAFGCDGWTSFVEALGDRFNSLGPGAVETVRIYSVFGLPRLIGAGPWISWGVHCAVAAAVTLAICVLWAKPIPYDLKAAALSLASVIVSPYVQFYDLCILSIAVAFLVKDGLSRGFLPGERIVILLCWAALFLMKTPVGPIVCSVLAFLCARRITEYRSEHPSSLPSAFGRVSSLLTFLNRIKAVNG